VAVDERLLLPASERYAGTFYKVAGPLLMRAPENGFHIVIISGGYGLVLPNEPSGNYEAVFKPSMWPRGLLQRALLSYAKRHGLVHIRAFVARSTAYRSVLDIGSWQDNGIEDAILFTPVVRGGGALVKTPKALGEAFCAAIDGELSAEWISSDGTPIEAHSL
jgi:hypothetical protein